MSEPTTTVYYPTIIYQETHCLDCICGLCNNTGCLATIRIQPRSAEEFENAVKRVLETRRG